MRTRCQVGRMSCLYQEYCAPFFEPAYARVRRLCPRAWCRSRVCLVIPLLVMNTTTSPYSHPNDHTTPSPDHDGEEAALSFPANTYLNSRQLYTGISHAPSACSGAFEDDKDKSGVPGKCHIPIAMKRVRCLMSAPLHRIGLRRRTDSALFERCTSD